MVAIPGKVTLNKNFVIKTRYIRNNDGFPILTKCYEGKKNDTRNITNINFVPEDIQSNSIIT